VNIPPFVKVEPNLSTLSTFEKGGAKSSTQSETESTQSEVQEVTPPLPKVDEEVEILALSSAEPVEIPLPLPKVDKIETVNNQ
jgi:hypothetical protein